VHQGRSAHLRNRNLRLRSLDSETMATSCHDAGLIGVVRSVSEGSIFDNFCVAAVQWL